MATNPALRRWTYAEFARLPDDGNRYEVIDGDLYMTPAPQPVHQELVARLSEILRLFVRQHGLGRVLPGPIDVLFAEGDYLEPDLVFVRRERLDAVSKRGVEAAPDLVIEVLSPTTAPRDRGIKRERYAYFGVPEYWLVDPAARRVEVYRLTEGPRQPPFVASESLDWQPVPGGPVLTIDVVELFRDAD